MEQGLLIGVDGGGTRTTAVAVRADGTVLATATGRGINYRNIGMDAARANLRAVVDALLARCAAAGYAHLCVGLSALDQEADEATRRAFAGDAFPPGTMELQSDAYIALMGATLGEPGAIVICGTGAMILLLDADGTQHVAQGWGHALGDVGSAYTLAVEGLRAAISAWEGLGEPTRLTDATTRFYGLHAPRELIERIYAPLPEPDRIAQFARAVLAEASAGDPVAHGIVTRNIRTLAHLCALLMAAHPEARRVGIYGGVFSHHPWVQRLFSEALCARHPDAQVGLPAYPPEVGAVLHSLRLRGALTPQVLARIAQTHAQAARTAPEIPRRGR